MNDIILMRHGETNANKNFIVQGRMDNPLNKNGVKQANAAGKYFVKHNINFDLVISSPLKRAYSTAKEVNRGMLIKRPIVMDKGVIERNFGDYDGKKITDDYYYLIKRGLVPNMETNEILEKRVFIALTDICNKYPNKRILIVTHSHVIKAVLTTLIKDFNYRSSLHNCALNHFIYDGKIFKADYYNLNPLN